jgi:hypothetical protein
MIRNTKYTGYQDWYKYIKVYNDKILKTLPTCRDTIQVSDVEMFEKEDNIDALEA